MMNFLDLSAASDEERRLISEILSDTSVVNFAEPLRQDFNRQQQHQANSTQPNNISRHQIDQQHYQNQQQPNHQLNTTKTAQNIYRPPQHHQQQPQIQQNHSTNAPNNVNHAQRVNHIHNQNASTTSENHRHTDHVQMSPQMAGDISPNIVGMDMSNAQHAGYPLPHPTSAHVSPAYGPPPPHHMYGGPPIFQPYPIIVPYHNLVYGNMPPYPVLPATNSVVTPRQQVPPQSSQPQSAGVPTSSHSRSHLHHSRQMKTKDQSSKQSSLHHNQHITNNQFPHQNQYDKQNHEMRPNDPSVTPSKTDNGRQESDYKVSQASNQAHIDGQQAAVTNGLETDSSPGNESKINHNKLTGMARADAHPRQANSEGKVMEVSSDKVIDTQVLNSDTSKHSRESSTVPTIDKTISSSEQTGPSTVDQANPNNADPPNQIDTSNQLLEGEKIVKPGPWSSAASKSWASLFKGDGSAIHGETSNGEELTGDSNDFEDDHSRNLYRKPINMDNNDAQSCNSAASKAQKSQDATRRALDKMAPRLAQKISSITLKHSLPLLRPRGFINKGNGCYINSTLQALIACPPFYNLMKEIGDLKDLRRENSCTPILDNFAELFLNFPPLDSSKKNKQTFSPDQKMQISQLQAEALEPRCIYDVLGQIKSECLRGKCLGILIQFFPLCHRI